MIIILTLWTGFAVPFESTFLNGATVPWVDGIDWLCDVVFILDVIISFRTAYYRSVGTMEVSGAKIAKRYLRTWFLVDALAAIPFDRLISKSNADIVILLRMGRLVRFGRLLKLIEYLKFSSLGGIIQMYVMVFLIGHWLACR